MHGILSNSDKGFPLVSQGAETTLHVEFGPYKGNSYERMITVLASGRCSFVMSKKILLHFSYSESTWSPQMTAGGSLWKCRPCALQSKLMIWKHKSVTSIMIIQNFIRSIFKLSTLPYKPWMMTLNWSLNCLQTQPQVYLGFHHFVVLIWYPLFQHQGEKAKADGVILET